MRKFIGLTGAKFSGKTTTFKFMQEDYPELQEVALAGKIKTACSEAFDIPLDFFHDTKLKETPLNTPLTLTNENLLALSTQYSTFIFDQDEHIRPHIGITLHTPREVLQYVGTEVLRSVNPDIHILAAVGDLPKEGTFVVTDIRFMNEFDYFLENYGSRFFPFYVHNMGAETKASADGHASEQEVLSIGAKCTKIDNNGSLEELRVNVLEALVTLKIKDGCMNNNVGNTV